MTNRARPFGELIADWSPERLARVAAYEAELLAEQARYNLAELRDRRQVTQEALAAAIGVTQPTVVAAEKALNPHLSTVARHVAGLGGRLRLVAEFDDEVVEVATIAAGEAAATEA